MLSRIRAWLPQVATAATVACAITLTALLVRREFFLDSGRAQGEPTHLRDWERLARSGRSMGSADAPITIVEFSDFQCPSCGRLQPDLRALRVRYPGRTRIVYRHLPLSRIHPHAEMAAEAAECAGAQDAFEQYHDALFAKQDSIGVKSWVSFGRDARLADTVEFNHCLTERRYAGRVRDDVTTARDAGFRGTPTLVVAGRVIRGRPPLEELERLIAP